MNNIGVKLTYSSLLIMFQTPIRLQLPYTRMINKWTPYQFHTTPRVHSPRKDSKSVKCSRIFYETKSHSTPYTKQIFQSNQNEIARKNHLRQVTSFLQQ